MAVLNTTLRELKCFIAKYVKYISNCDMTEEDFEDLSDVLIYTTTLGDDEQYEMKISVNLVDPIDCKIYYSVRNYDTSQTIDHVKDRFNYDTLRGFFSLSSLDDLCSIGYKLIMMEEKQS